MENRILKFRAWDKAQNKMIIDYLVAGGKVFGKYRMALSFTGGVLAFTDWELANYEEDEMHNTSCYVDRFELMQYTGHNDLSGNEIYEDDRLYDKPMNKTFHLIWSHPAAAWILQDVSTGEDYWLADYFNEQKACVMLIVIGNSHEREETKGTHKWHTANHLGEDRVDNKRSNI